MAGCRGAGGLRLGHEPLCLFDDSLWKRHRWIDLPVQNEGRESGCWSSGICPAECASLVWAVRGKTLGRDQREGWLARSVSRRTRVMRRKSVKYKNGASSWQGCWRSEVAWQIDVNAGCFVARKASIRFGRFRGAPRVTRALHRARPHEALPHFSECTSAANLCPRILIQTALGRAADPRESLSTSFSSQLPEPTRINYVGPYRAGF